MTSAAAEPCHVADFHPSTFRPLAAVHGNVSGLDLLSLGETLIPHLGLEVLLQ